MSIRGHSWTFVLKKRNESNKNSIPKVTKILHSSFFILHLKSPVRMAFY